MEQATHIQILRRNHSGGGTRICGFARRPSPGCRVVPPGAGERTEGPLCVVAAMVSSSSAFRPLHAGSSWSRHEYAPKCTVRLLENASNLMKTLVGAGRFERPTPCAQGRCATRLRYAPTELILHHFRSSPAGEAERSAAGGSLSWLQNESGESIAYAGRSIDSAEPKCKLPAGFKNSRVLFKLRMRVPPIP